MAAAIPPALNRTNRVPTNLNVNGNQTSGRYLIWYGWRDLINPNIPGIFPAFVAKMETFQCSAILPNTNGVRCTKRVVMGSDVCHLHLRGVRAQKTYIYHSFVVDTIISVRATQAFHIGDVVMQLHAELLTEAQHVARYQDPDRCGPHEFAFRNTHNHNQIYYIDCSIFCSEGDFLPIDDNNGNVYLDMNQQHFNFHAQVSAHNGLRHFEHGVIRPINLIARRNIDIDDNISVKVANTPSSPNFNGLPRATHQTADIEDYL